MKYEFEFSSEEETFVLVAAGNPGVYCVAVDAGEFSEAKLGPVGPDSPTLQSFNDGSSEPLHLTSYAPIGARLFRLGHMSSLLLYMTQNPSPPVVKVAVERVGC